MAEKIPEALLLEEEGHLVDGLDVADLDDLLILDLAGAGDLLRCARGEGTLASACDLVKTTMIRKGKARQDTYGTDHVRNQASASHLPDGVLGRLGLLLTMDARQGMSVTNSWISEARPRTHMGT